MRGHNAMMKRREGAITWKGKNLYKPFADDHGTPSPTKDNKAMVILPGISKDAVKVFDSRGIVIDIMRRFLPDHEDGPRYYSGRYAFELAQSARRATGSGLIRVENMPLTDGDLRSKPR